MPNTENKLYNVKDVAGFFDKTPAWVYWCIRNDKFAYENGQEIPPTSQTTKGSKKMYDLDAIQAMSLSLYRFGNLSEKELREVLARILVEKEKLLKEAE